MSKLSSTLADPRRAALLGAVAGAAKGLLVGAVTGKLLLFSLLGAAGGAATSLVLSRLARGGAAAAEKLP